MRNRVADKQKSRSTDWMSGFVFGFAIGVGYMALGLVAASALKLFAGGVP